MMKRLTEYIDESDGMEFVKKENVKKYLKRERLTATSHLSLASAMTGVRGWWARLRGLSNIWDSSLVNSIFSSG